MTLDEVIVPWGGDYVLKTSGGDGALGRWFRFEDPKGVTVSLCGDSILKILRPYVCPWEVIHFEDPKGGDDARLAHS